MESVNSALKEVFAQKKEECWDIAHKASVEKEKKMKASPEYKKLKANREKTEKDMEELRQKYGALQPYEIQRGLFKKLQNKYTKICVDLQFSRDKEDVTRISKEFEEFKIDLE